MINISKRLNKANNGITLVALVVTIVVLLILAGITITMLFSDNGIITKAREAADTVDKAQGDTLNGLNDLADDMDVALGEAPKLKEQGKLVPIDTKFAKYTDSTSSDVVPIPGGYGVVKDSTTGEKNTIASGLVISNLENDTLDNELIDGKRGNQFVWVPVNSAQLADMYGVDSNGKKRGKLYNFSTGGKANRNWTETDGVMNITSATSFREPDTVTDYDGKATYLNILSDLETKTRSGFRVQLQSEFDSMIDSMQKYKGFYIGRYETGNLSNSDNTVKAVVQKEATVGNANWYYQYQEIKNMAKDNNNTVTSMIWGCQWDRTIDWIVETNSTDKNNLDYTIVTDSRSWGSHSDSTGDAATNSGASVKSSGTNSAWQKNHIYDLAGNAWDWTIEADTNYLRVTRRRRLGRFWF